ncbi:MAG TPA: 4-hydroxybenzoyl-CoA reductase [Chloroflexi bacterium]|nr:4-hydroxybenzoyl-CoA reductase [Chloroflexota bacterium]
MHQLEILQPRSLADASRMLTDYQDEAKVVGAGTAIVLMLTQRLIAPRYLVSLGHLPNLRGLEYEPGVGLRIGALVTHYEMESSPVVRQAVPALAETFHQVANIRIRHQATVGGVLCEADYASDPPSMLVALRACVRAVSVRGERWIELTDFFQDFFLTALEPDEIVTEIFVPEMAPDSSATYIKFNSRSSEDRPCVGIAAVVERENGACQAVRVVIGAASATPQEVIQAEMLASGRPMTEDLAREIGRAYAQAIDPISDMRGTDWYRRQVIEALVRRALLHAARA